MQTPENNAETNGFARGLFVCEKPGHEFASVGSTASLVSLIATQGFAMLFLVPIMGYLVLRDLLGVSALMAGTAAGLLCVPILIGGALLITRVNQVQYKQGTYFKSETDSRFRVRAVIPKKRQTARIMRWADAAVHAQMPEERETVIVEDQLQMVRGGFEPIIVRPWFGIKRNARFWWTAFIMGAVCVLVLLHLLSLMLGGWSGVLRASGFMGYALMGAGMVGGVVSAELIWPVYLRLVPGRLDLFEYGPLGSGKPRVETHNLNVQGVCVDFGTYTIAIEPARPVGEPLPKLVQSSRWPHGQVLPEGHVPRYVCLALIPGRREIAQRVIQAARTDEPTPAVSEGELSG